MRIRMQDPPPPPLLAPAAALLRRLAPYGLQVPDAWLQPRIVLLDVGARPSEQGRIAPSPVLRILLPRSCPRPSLGEK